MLLSIKKFGTKSWIFVKRYWKIIGLGVLALAVFFIFRDKSDELFDLIRKERELAKKETEAIEESYQTELKERAIADEKLVSSLSQIDKDYADGKKAISRKEKQKALEYIRKSEGDSDSINQAIADLIGADYKKRD